MGTERRNKPKIIVVLGPTASGKSDLAVSIAKKFNGEIVSADSRQLYKGMDIGAGKVPRDSDLKSQKNPYCYKGIKHHLLDVASPKRKFSVAQYQKLARKSIKNIIRKNKIPVLCGGTAFYIKAIIEGIEIPESSPNWKLRKDLEKKSLTELYQMLEKMDPERAGTIEKNNPRRLIRALEIVIQTRKPVPSLKTNPEYNPLFIGIRKNQKELNEKIEKRLEERIKKGMMTEVKKLRKSGVSWKRLESFGLEYEWTAKCLQKKISDKEMRENLLRDIIKFSKKQMAWWKNDKRIKWIKSEKKAESLVKKFLE